MKRLLLPLFLLLGPVSLSAESPAPRILADIAYKSGDALSDYEKERCKLDFYLPAAEPGFPTLVWFHGGGLTGGSKDSDDIVALGKTFSSRGIAFAAVNYRLSPRAIYPAYIDDAAASVAWAIANVPKSGGDAKKVFAGGHSAGGYLTLMLGMDEQYLSKLGLNLSDLAGLIPLSGQTMTHYTVRKEKTGSDNPFTPYADEAAPIYYASRKNIPPLLMLWADNDMAARAEENAYLVALLKGAGHPDTTGVEIMNRDHGSIAFEMANAADPGRLLVEKFITRQSGEGE